MTNELQWKKVTYPGVRPDMYMVSENGDVMNAIDMSPVYPYLNNGYYRIKLLGDKGHPNGCNIFIHRLVAFQFVPNSNNYPVVDHLDGHKRHNHYTNLEWVTIQENTRRAYLLGIIPRSGLDNSEELIRSICEKLQDGWRVRDIFRWLMNNQKARPEDNFPLFQLIHRIKNRENWDNITKDYVYESNNESRASWDKKKPGIGNNKYTEEQIRFVCKLFEEGKSAQDILEIMTGSRRQKDNRRIYDFIDGIRRKKSWTEISCEYNIDNSSTPTRNTGWTEEIADMVDRGLSNSEIYKVMKEKDPTFNTNTKNRIKRMIDQYITFVNLQSNATIISEE